MIDPDPPACKRPRRRPRLRAPLAPAWPGPSWDPRPAPAPAPRSRRTISTATSPGARLSAFIRRAARRSAPLGAPRTVVDEVVQARGGCSPSRRSRGPRSADTADGWMVAVTSTAAMRVLRKDKVDLAWSAPLLDVDAEEQAGEPTDEPDGDEDVAPEPLAR